MTGKVERCNVCRREVCKRSDGRCRCEKCHDMTPANSGLMFWELGDESPPVFVDPAPSRTAASLAGPSLAQLVDARNRIALWHLGQSFAEPLTAEHIATIAYALGVLSAERLAAGDRLDAGEAGL